MAARAWGAINLWKWARPTFLRMLRGYSTPDALDMAHQDVAPFLHCKRAAQTTDKHRAKFDLLRSKAEPRMRMGRPSPEAFVSILRMQNAPLHRTDKSLAPVSARGNLGIAVASQMRRIIGPKGASARQDALMATGNAGKPQSLPGVGDFEGWAVYRKARRSFPKEEKWGGQGGRQEKRKGAGRTCMVLIPGRAGDADVICATVETARRQWAPCVGARARRLRPLYPRPL